MIAFLQRRIARRFRALLSGNPNGDPPWLGAVAEGSGEGFYRPGDAPWVVHGDMATLVGGIRALLMQALHPGSLAGVRAHSRYMQDPLGRLAGTIQWLTVTTFASRESIIQEAARVRAMHQKVRGSYVDAGGEQREYKASDRDLLMWVHIAFMDSFLRCHQQYSAVPIPGGADDYIRLWSQAVEPLGLEDAPKSEREMLAEIRKFEPELVLRAEGREVIEWIRRPPLPLVSRLIYRLLFQAAYLTLPDSCRKMIGLGTMPRWLVIPATRRLLLLLRFAIGPDSPIEDAALERIRRSEAAGG